MAWSLTYGTIDSAFPTALDNAIKRLESDIDAAEPSSEERKEINDRIGDLMTNTDELLAKHGSSFITGNAAREAVRCGNEPRGRDGISHHELRERGSALLALVGVILSQKGYKVEQDPDRDILLVRVV